MKDLIERERERERGEGGGLGIQPRVKSHRSSYTGLYVTPVILHGVVSPEGGRSTSSVRDGSGEEREGSGEPQGSGEERSGLPNAATTFVAPATPASRKKMRVTSPNLPHIRPNRQLHRGKLTFDERAVW